MRAIYVTWSPDLDHGRIRGLSPREHLRATAVATGVVLHDGDDTSEPWLDGRYLRLTAEVLGWLADHPTGTLLAEGRVIGGTRRDVDGPVRELGPDQSTPIRTPAELVGFHDEQTRAALLSLANAGVCFPDGLQSIALDTTVTVFAGASIGMGVVLKGHTVVAPGARIDAGCWLNDTQVGANAVLKPRTVCDSAVIGEGCSVGPMAHLREGTVLHRDVKVGNFVETKKSTLRDGAKANHLTYLGDATIGEGSNIGAGTITCNYDGANKHPTVIGAWSFIGSNTALVAPVTLGERSLVAAGSVVSTKEPLNDGALVIERSELRVLEHRGEALLNRNRATAGKGPLPKGSST